MPEKTLLPTRKVAGAGIAGAAFSLLVYILNKYVSPFREHPLSGELATWATTVLAGLTAYLVPPGASEATVRDSGTGRVRSALQREERKKLAIGTGDDSMIGPMKRAVREAVIEAMEATRAQPVVPMTSPAGERSPRRDTAGVIPDHVARRLDRI